MKTLWVQLLSRAVAALVKPILVHAKPTIQKISPISSTLFEKINPKGTM